MASIAEVGAVRMKRIGLVPRLAQSLQASTYDTAWGGPNELWVYEATKMLVGAAGWREIATEENIRLLLQNTKLRLTLGQEKCELMLAAVEV
jgi:hypothetical protein